MKSSFFRSRAAIFLLTAVLAALHSRATNHLAAAPENCGDMCRFLAEEAARECAHPDPVPAGILAPR